MLLFLSADCSVNHRGCNNRCTQASCIQYCFSIGNFSFPKANTSTWLLLVVKESLTSIGVHLKF